MIYLSSCNLHCCNSCPCFYALGGEIKRIYLFICLLVFSLFSTCFRYILSIPTLQYQLLCLSSFLLFPFTRVVVAALVREFQIFYSHACAGAREQHSFLIFYCFTCWNLLTRQGDHNNYHNIECLYILLCYYYCCCSVIIIISDSLGAAYIVH